MTPEFKTELYELFEEEDESIEIVEDGEWTENGKYSYKDTIVKYQDTYYQISESRSGSYFTDYHYNDPDIYQVARREEPIIKTFWDIIK
jgi:hypothetical protein